MAQVIDFLPTNIIDRRITMILYVSGYMCNFQGDPDNANSPRLDSDERAFMTPMGFRRKVRDVAAILGYLIHVGRGLELAAPVIQRAAELGIDIEEDEPATAEPDGKASKAEKKAPAKKSDKTEKAGVVKRRKGHALRMEDKNAIIKKMGDHYFDFRAFGGTLTTLNHGETAPIHVGFGVTVDPVELVDMTIGRVAVANAKELESKDRTLGSMVVCKYGLMAFEMSISPKCAARTGLTWRDYETFVDIVTKMWDNTKSTGRGKMVNEKLVSFIHRSHLGDIQDARLTDAVRAEWVTKADGDVYPRSIKDYQLSIDRGAIPPTVDVIETRV